MATTRKPVTTVWNRERKVDFGTFLDGGWFSAAPDDGAVNRAIRTNNPGALNISKWQKSLPGYVGQTAPDKAGNVTTIYSTPEQGVAAFYHLIAERYGFSKQGQFDLESLAKKYAGSKASRSAIKAYLDGWAKWSGGSLQPSTVVHLANDAEMLEFSKAVFAHEAAAGSPLRDDQILDGFRRGRSL